jgi:uncharacterized protein YhhL (DUF1145 family)
MLEVIQPVFAAIENSALGLSIRNAHTLYPLANVTHVVGVIIFFALVAAMDMAVLRRTLQEARETIWRTRKYAIFAFLLVVSSGTIMFIAEAGALVKNLSFQLKAAAIGVAGINLWLFGFIERRGWQGGMRFLALISLLTWLFAAAAGRGIAYL